MYLYLLVNLYSVQSDSFQLHSRMMKKKAIHSTTNSNNGEVYLERKTRKRWVDEKSGHTCFMLYPKALYVTWAWGNHAYWKWNCYKEISDENIEVLKLSHVCWLDVRGRLKMCDLPAGTVYEIVYDVKLTKGSSGWELPIKLKLYTLPDGISTERQLSLFGKPKGQWMQLHVGEFQVDHTNENGEVCFDLYEHGGHWKSGLIIRGAIIRPKIG